MIGRPQILICALNFRIVFLMDIGTKLAENVIFAFYLHKYVICVFFIVTQFPIEKFIFDSESARNRVFLFFPTIACQMCT